MSQMRVCSIHAIYVNDQRPCNQCAFLSTAVAPIVGAPSMTMHVFRLDILDAVAVILRERAETRRRHRRELNEELRHAQRDASAAYSEGRFDAAQEREA